MEKLLAFSHSARLLSRNCVSRPGWPELRAGPSLSTQPCVPGPGRSERSTVDCGAGPGTNQRPGEEQWTNEERAVTREGLGRGPVVLQSAE